MFQGVLTWATYNQGVRARFSEQGKRVPTAQRQIPLHLQIANYYKDRILAGDEGYHSGDKLPSIRAIRDEWSVGFQTAQRAVDYLSKTEGLVRTSAEGTFVNGHRGAWGPQQRLRAIRSSAAELVTVREAGITEAPAYIIPVLDLQPDGNGKYWVVRREWVTAESNGHPYKLSVSWCPYAASLRVPELLAIEPLPEPGSTPRLVAERMNLPITWGTSAREARKVKDDGRESPLLGLQLGDSVLAEVELWGTTDMTLAYLEHAIREGRVIESELEP